MEKPLIEVAGAAAKPIYDSFLNYLHLGSWLNQRFSSILAKKPVRLFSSVSDFWSHVFTENITVGDRIKFTEAFITEWVPRVPGGLWRSHNASFDNLDYIRKGKRLFFESDPRDPSDKPFGVVRLPFGSIKSEFAVLSLTTYDAWHCDLGIPLLVSSSVYDSFVSRRFQRNAVEGEVEGILCLGKPVLLDAELLGSLGSDINKAHLSGLITPESIPYVYLKIVSPLDVNFRSHNTHPPGFLWNINRLTYRYGESNNTRDFENQRDTTYIRYEYKGLSAKLNILDEVEACVNAFRIGDLCVLIDESSDNLRLKFRDEPHEGLRAILKNEVLTEFDARSRHFRTSVPLTINPWRNEANVKKINQTLTELLNLL